MSQRVRDIGEFALIERLIAALPESARGQDSVFGQQDDCAYWQASTGTTVVTTDALVEGVHFRLDWTDWRSLGHKMLAVNLSDLASMGCVPRTAFVTLALTGDELISDLEELYRGAGELAAIYDVAIAGGDIVRTSGPIVINVTAIGEQVPDLPLMTRSAAKPGDAILVSGTLGASAAGLRLLQENRRDAATAALLIGAHLRPQPRVSLGQALVNAGVRCCMDLSDGLAGDLPKILFASDVGARIDPGKVPFVPAITALFPEERLPLTLHGGEDYELLCTVPPSMVHSVVNAARLVGATLTEIGQITVKEQDASGFTPDAGGWDHFGDK